MSPGLTTPTRAKIGDRNATYLLATVIDTLELDSNNYISRLAIRRGRISAWSKIREDFQTASVGIQRLLSVPKLNRSTRSE